MNKHRPEPARIYSRYRCPAHHAPVTWRGTGCPKCAQERRDHAETRRQRRAERAAARTARSNRTTERTAA